jgi:hypothetical protein
MEPTSTPGQHPPGPCPPAEEGAGRKQSMEHPSTAGIEDFLACLLPREQNRLVVRHLLARCPTCLSDVQYVLYPAASIGRESSVRRSGESRAAYSLAIDRFLQRLEDLVELFDA